MCRDRVFLDRVTGVAGSLSQVLLPLCLYSEKGAQAPGVGEGWPFTIPHTGGAGLPKIMRGTPAASSEGGARLCKSHSQL